MTKFRLGYLKKSLAAKYGHYLFKYEVWQFDRYRKSYDSLPFNHKIKLAHKWLKQYPEQAHFNYTTVNYWLRNIVQMPANILEIGGWRGDLAEKALSSFEQINLWHNFDLLKNNDYQKCNDERYKLIPLNENLWHLSLTHDYNALIATHMIEHINWRELVELINWIPLGIRTVLFEAPLPASDENINWRGDHSSHVLEKGWKQVISEMKNHSFYVDYTQDITYIFRR